MGRLHRLSLRQGLSLRHRLSMRHSLSLGYRLSLRHRLGLRHCIRLRLLTYLVTLLSRPNNDLRALMRLSHRALGRHLAAMELL